MNYLKKATKSSINKTIKFLIKNGFDAELVPNGLEAKKRVLKLIPKNSSVMTMTSVTLDALGIPEAIEKSGQFEFIRNKLAKLDQKTKGQEMKKLASVPDVAIGSVHALTMDGKIMIASATGSQLPAYVYGASKVIFVVGTQKIVKNLEDGMKRIYEHILPLESERAKKAYGVSGSSVNKLLVLNKETPGRISVVFVDEVLGF
ncbi:MAG: lactate utilization protein [Parcubacteria group bacterium]|nr:lactate utilization protein [Parcubacteria group bacterium]